MTKFKKKKIKFVRLYLLNVMNIDNMCLLNADYSFKFKYAGKEQYFSSAKGSHREANRYNVTTILFYELRNIDL